MILERKSDYREGQPNRRERTLQQWAACIDKMFRFDNRTPQQVEDVIRWSQRDNFWRNNVLSAEKLRKNFDQLELKMKDENGAHKNRGHNEPAGAFIR